MSKITELYIHQRVVDYPHTQAVRDQFDNIPSHIVQDSKAVYRRVLNSSSDTIGRGKRVLFLTHNQGAFVKSCPGTRAYTCCGYNILNIGTFCTLDCSYCILQSYFHPPVLQYFVNHDVLFSELTKFCRSEGIHRIGTGEFTDSMIWERWTNLSELLIPYFANTPNCVLELKTKTTAIHRLKKLDHNQKTIMAWSLNTEQVIREEERGTASLTARLSAAADCASWGYPLAFHFDPMVIYDGCEKDYQSVIEVLFSHIDPSNVVWISLGSFRFMPALKPIIQQRFPKSKIIYGEFVSGLDGKMRYFKPLRISLYRAIIKKITEIAPNVLVYFCMEDDEVWSKSLGYLPKERGGLERMLDESAKKHCSLK